MKKLIFGFTLFFCPGVFAQVSFTAAPSTLQFYSRDTATDSGSVTISGHVDKNATAYSEVKVKTYRNDTLTATNSLTLSYSGDSAAFSFDLGIKAGLCNYKYEIYGVNGTTETLIRKADSVVCGDVYIIQGQSNAEAQMYDGSASENNSPFIRVFGSADTAAGDTLWRIGQGDGDMQTMGNVGQWGLRMCKLIVDEYKIPIAVFNGAHGGMAIQYFQRNDTRPDTQNTNYGRLLFRLEKTGLAKNVRAIFWVQGEENANIAGNISTYKKWFKELRSDWLENYPNVKKIYVFQIRNGCSTAADRIIIIKEAHRQLGEDYSDVPVMSTSAQVHESNNCHYPYTGGYKLMADNIYRLVRRDFYGASYAADIEPPDIKFAEISGKSEITLYMKRILDSLIWDTAWSDTDFSFNVSFVTVSGGATNGNKVILSLSSSASSVTNITFLGHQNSPEPFVLNRNGVGSMHFYQFPITTAKYRDSVSVAAILAVNSITKPVDSVVTYSGNRIVAIKLGGMNIVTIPSDIGFVDSLKSIDLGNNLLTDLPREIVALSPSGSLNVKNNRLCGLSDTITAWINSFAGDTTWKITQTVDGSQVCRGTNVIFGKSKKAGDFSECSYSHNRLTIKFSDVSDRHEVRIFGANGACATAFYPRTGIADIDMSVLRRGVYIVRIKTAGNYKTFRFCLM
jgi:hypothetical protein